MFVGLHLLAAWGHSFAEHGDEAFFVLLAKSLREGAFAIPGPFGFPVTDPLPGFPLLIAFPQWLLEPRWDSLWLLGLVPSFLALFLTWRLARRLLPSGPAAIAAGLTALNPSYIRFAGILMPDMAFTALTLWVLESAADVRRERAILGLSLAAALAALMRPHGSLLVLCVTLGLAADCGPRKAAAFFVSAAAPIGLWILRNHWVSGVMTNYAVNWRTQIASLAEWGEGGPPRIVAELIGGYFLALWSSGIAPQLAAGMVALGLAGHGVMTLMRGREPRLAFMAASFCGLVIALHLTWGSLSYRYILPLAPLLWIFIPSLTLPA